MQVRTNIKTLKKVKRLANELGLGYFLDGNQSSQGELTVRQFVNRLLDENKLVEFCQIVTGDDKADFEEMEASEIGGIIENFFTGIIEFVPSFLRGKIPVDFKAKTSS